MRAISGKLPKDYERKRINAAVSSDASSLAPNKHDLARERLHGFAVLIARDVTHGRCAPIWARTRGQNLQNLAFDLKHIARTRWPRPRKFAACADDTASDRHGLDDQPHCDRRCMPSARRQPAKQRVTRDIFIQMKWLRIVLGSKGFDLTRIQRQCAAKTLRSSRKSLS